MLLRRADLSLTKTLANINMDSLGMRGRTKDIVVIGMGRRIWTTT